MKVLWAVGSRAGGEFLIRLTLVFSQQSLPRFEQALHPRVRINTYRKAEKPWDKVFEEFHAQGQARQFFQAHRFQSAKIEDPGVDGLCYDLLDDFPEARVVCTFRPIEKIATSHDNIKPWGMSLARAVEVFQKSLKFYETAYDRGQLYMVSIEDRDRFSPQKFEKFLGMQAGVSAQDLVHDWPVVNDLAHQKAISGDQSALGKVYSFDEIVCQYPGVAAATEKYKALASEFFR